MIDSGGEEIAWGSDYAILEQDGWRFPDGELCSKPDGLRKAFQRRQRRGDDRTPTTAWELEPVGGFPTPKSCERSRRRCARRGCSGPRAIPTAAW